MGRLTNPVAIALAEGVAPLRIAVAAHEIGHGLAWRAAGFPCGTLQLRTGLFGGLAEASCPHGATGRVTADNIVGFLTGYPAGAVAQARCARLYLHGRHRSGGDAHDRSEFRWLARRWDQPISYSGATRAATRLIAARGGHLDALTARLARTGHLPASTL